MLRHAAVVDQVVRQKLAQKSTRLRKLLTWLRDNQKWLVTAALFAFCVAPTFISYQPYTFESDDAEYLRLNIEVSQILWYRGLHGLRWTMSNSVKPPAMMLLGFPWGPLASWDAAGKCFITLAAVISLVATTCLYLLLRIGVRPFFLVLAGVCVGASLGPYPHAGEMHDVATGFMADSLLAWTALAAMLLIPYEARTPCPLIRDAVLRGIIWGAILSLGMMTKLSFFYFIVFIVPLLCLVHFNCNGYRSTRATLIAFACSSAPAALYLLLCGRSVIDNAKAGSFGRLTYLFYIPLLQFLGDTIRDSPGLMLSLTMTPAALIYLLIKRRLVQLWPDFLALLIVIGFGIVVLASPNREVRFSFPTIVVVPFLAAILMSGKGHPAPRPSAVLAAVLVFCGLLAAGVPTQHRGDIQSLRRSDAILTQAARCNAKHIILATDIPTLNTALLRLAIAISASKDSIEVGTLPHDAMYRVLPVEEGFRKIRDSDQVVFQNLDAFSDRILLRTGSILHEYSWESLRPFNQGVPEYERHIQELGYVPIAAYDDVNVYSLRCRP